MKKYFPYDLSNPQPVAGELHRILNGQIRLEHIPTENSLEIQGYIAAKSATHLQANEFFCDYSRSTNYREANRIVWFSTSQDSKQVSCSYLACGSPVTADDMNEIKSYMETGDDKFSTLTETVSTLKNSVTELKTDSAKAIREHEQNPDAHSDIRDEITSNQQQALLAIANMNRTIADAENNARAAVNSVSLHITDPTAHNDIRTEISNLRDEMNSLSGISSAINEHNEDTNAHEFIQNLIDVESINRANADNLLEEKINSLSSTINSTVIQSLSSLSSAIYSVVDSKLLGLSSKLDAEILDRTTAINQLELKLDSIVDAGLSGLSSKLDDEIINRTTAINQLELKLDSIVDAGLSGLSSKLDNEILARTTAINQLELKLDSIVDAGLSGLSSKLDDEILARQSADNYLDGKINALSSTVNNVIDPELNLLSSRIDAEIVARSNVDNLLDEKISKSMTFGGTSTIYPTNPTVGTFAIVSGVPYVYDGSRWLKLQGEEEVQPGSLSFLDIAFSNKPPDGYSALNKADFLRYVFGDDTPTTYDDTNKDSFLNAIF